MFADWQCAFGFLVEDYRVIGTMFKNADADHYFSLGSLLLLRMVEAKGKQSFWSLASAPNRQFVTACYREHELFISEKGDPAAIHGWTIALLTTCSKLGLISRQSPKYRKAVQATQNKSDRVLDWTGAETKLKTREDTGL